MLLFFDIKNPRKPLFSGISFNLRCFWKRAADGNRTRWKITKCTVFTLCFCFVGNFVGKFIFYILIQSNQQLRLFIYYHVYLKISILYLKFTKSSMFFKKPRLITRAHFVINCKTASELCCTLPHHPPAGYTSSGTPSLLSR